MKVYNVGDRIMNTWIYEASDGYIMIDTGDPESGKSDGPAQGAEFL